jgi:ORF6N domain
MVKTRALVPSPRIENQILLIRAEKVMLDADLAALYGVTTKRLNEQVKRNAARFPEDFMFRLTGAEIEVLNRSQIATGSQKHRDPRFPPYAFTEHGAIQAANVLNSARAVEMSVHVVRAFVRLREMVAANKDLAKKLDAIERKVASHDQAIVGLIDAIRQLTTPAPTKRRPIGFVTPKEK